MIAERCQSKKSLLRIIVLKLVLTTSQRINRKTYSEQTLAWYERIYNRYLGIKASQTGADVQFASTYLHLHLKGSTPFERLATPDDQS